MMRNACLTLACALALVGCDDGETPEGDAGPELMLPEATAFTENEAAEEFESASIDLSCLGSRTQPTAGEEIDVTFQLRDFQDDFEVPEIDVWLFTDNVIADTCDGANCQLITTDAMGDAQVTLRSNGWYAYRVLPFDGPSRGTTVFGVFQYNEVAPAAAGSSVEGASVSGSTIDLIPALLGIPREEGRAILAGTVYDCNEANVMNAIVRVYDPDGNLVEEGERITDPHYHYFDGNAANNLPDQTAEHTSEDGLYVIPQVPVADERPYRIEAWATVDNELTMIACESARIFGDAVTILNLAPLRADAPAECLTE